jgi:hypothetical protein
MIEILHFACESFWNFFGTIIILCVIGFWLVIVASHLGRIGRPRKHTKFSMKDTHKL